MTFLFNQPVAHRFGVSLQEFLNDGQWNEWEVAVAWVRRSGTCHLLPNLQVFLARGGTARFTVGVDIENTSQEGLQDLLELAAYGMSEVFVYHNESNSTFHPKLYLFANQSDARLIVGSNNLTEAGLFINTEAGLLIDVSADDPLIVETRVALASWRDPTEGLARPLDQSLLNDLAQEGYVLPEAKLRQRRRQSAAAARHASTGRKLFGRKRILAPPRPQQPPEEQHAGKAMIGRVLLMRVRRASETERRTQVQFPIRLIRTNFFAAIESIQSAHDNRTHGLRQASARGGLNTIKVEIPEIDTLPDPVLRLERAPSGIVYQAFDANSVLGRPIMEALRRGLTQKPPSTVLTVPSSPMSSTWYRFI